ncbi:MAG: TlyA family RNA methyltransferase [Erysipelotrichia bacterium]|nr:TlyA family RNA methyltransferase [Erysipelotrichia bacterium]
MAKKARIDELTVSQGLATDLDSARRLIMAGEIRTKDHVWEKAGEKTASTTVLELKSRHCKWVSRGGLKLEKAITDFAINPAGCRCLDIGASTGGFTDVLLQNGAAEVFAVDVGYGLLDAKIQQNPRVIVKDRTNFRMVADNEFGEPFDIVVTDVSFISLKMILPKATAMLKNSGSIIALIKPQFEAERDQVPEGGIITDPGLHIRIIEGLKLELSCTNKIFLHAISPVPMVSHKKNIEYLSLWNKNTGNLSMDEIQKIVTEAHSRLDKS